VRRRTMLTAAAALALTLASPAQGSFINYSAREINVKVVYFGPTWAQLERTLKHIHGRTNERARGKLISLATKDQRVLFFDFVPPGLGEIRGFKTRFHLYTAPDRQGYDASRRLVLKGVDAVVFVADASPARARANRESWKRLRTTLDALGYPLREVPLVVQLDGAGSKARVSARQLEKQLGLSGRRVIAADSSTGVGVFDTLKAAAKSVLLLLKRGAEQSAPKGAQKR
jgi:phosphatidylserine/phosphatidylglycerophosphate/cardiolipin synthase-like enzyme